MCEEQYVNIYLRLLKRLDLKESEEFRLKVFGVIDSINFKEDNVWFEHLATFQQVEVVLLNIEILYLTSFVKETK